MNNTWPVKLLLVCGITMLIAGNGLQFSLLGLRAGIEDFSALVTGTFMSAYYAGYLFGSKYCGALILRVGHIRTFAGLAALASAMPLLHGLFVDPFAWIPLRAISGLCFVGLSMVMESWINGRATNSDRGTWLAVYMIVSLASMAAAQQLLYLALPTGISLFVLSALLTSLAVVPVALTPSMPPQIPTGRKLTLRRLFEISPLGVTGCFATGLSSGAFWSLAALMAHEIGFSTPMVAHLVSTVILGGIVLQWPVGQLSNRFDRRKIIIVASLCVAITSGMISLLADDVNLYLFPLGFIVGGFMLSLYSLCVAHTNDFMTEDDLVSASGGLLFSFGLGALLGPVIAAAAIAIVGPRGLFIHIATVAVGLAIFGVIRVFSRAPVPNEAQEQFVAVPETTPVAERLDPRVAPAKARRPDVASTQVSNAGDSSTGQYD